MFHGDLDGWRLPPDLFDVGPDARDGDIIVAAGLRAFQFLDFKPSKIQRSPQGAWGLLVNGRARTAQYLTGKSYFLTFTQNQLVLGTGESSSAPFLFRRSAEKVEALYRENGWSLIQFGVSKGEPKASIFNTGVWEEVEGLPMAFMQLSADRKSVFLRGPEFQIVLFEEPKAPRARP